MSIEHESVGAPNLKQFEKFDAGETHTKIAVLMHADTYRDIAQEILMIATVEERDAMLDAAIKYAEMNTTVEGYRIMNSRHIVDTILPDTFEAVQQRLISSNPTDARLIGLELENEKASTLKSIADTHQCLMGDVLTVGTSIRNAARRHYKMGRNVIAVLKNSDTHLTILPMS